jgi:hypothetical protein
MKRAFLLIVVPVLLVALGSSQTPTPSVNTDQTNIKGCLGGSDGSYTVLEDNTGHTFKITASGVDLKQHLGHDVTLIGHRASGTSSAAADNNFAVSEMTMISEHCAAAAAPTATVLTPSETASTPAVPPAPAAAPAAAPTTSTSALPATEVTPAADAGAMAATVATPAEPTLTPAPSATPPAEIAVIPTVAPAASSATASTVWDKPAVDAVPPTHRPERFRSVSAPPVAAAVAPAATASKSSEHASTPDVAATTPAANANAPETVTTPDAAPTTPPAPARHGALWLLIAFAVLVIALGIFVPFLSRWRKQKSMARTDAPNLSFTREATTDQDKEDSQGPRKAA